MKDNSTLIVIVLDRSSSMMAVKEPTIAGFNEFLKGQQSAPGEANISLIQFDDKYEVNYSMIDIKKAEPLSNGSFVPRGSTALLDAVGKAINETGLSLSLMKEEDRPSKVIFVIQTDGEENCSREFSKEKIFSMISHQRETYSWEFIFLGADQDAIKAADSIGIRGATAMAYSNTRAGNESMYKSVNSSVLRSRGGGTLDFLDTEREEAIDKN